MIGDARIKIHSFPCSFQQKNCKDNLLRELASPQENPKSATEVIIDAGCPILITWDAQVKLGNEPKASFTSWLLFYTYIESCMVKKDYQWRL